MTPEPSTGPVMAAPAVVPAASKMSALAPLMTMVRVRGRCVVFFRSSLGRGCAALAGALWLYSPGLPG
jgi:hypothetical protein